MTARSLVWVVFQDAGFDADQAVVGLMAKHLAEGRAFPLFYYGQNYMLAVEAWIAAPLFMLVSPSAAALKSVALVLNVVTGCLLVRELLRTCRLSTGLALAAGLFVLMPAPAASAFLGRPSGANIEPLLAVLLLWLTRERPLWFGAVLALGVLTREFTLYGLGALLVVEALAGRLCTPRSLTSKGLALLTFGAVWDAVRLLKPYSSMYGPGTGGLAVQTRSNVEQIAGYAALRPQEWWSAIGELITRHLPDLFGARLEVIAAAVPGVPGTQGMTGLWPLLAAVLVLSLAAGGARLAARREYLRDAGVQFSLYLTLVGLAAALVYAVARGTHMHIVTMRYVLLALYLPVGILALVFSVEKRAWLRWCAVGGVAAWAVVCLADTGRMVLALAADPPVLPQRALSDCLQARGMKYGRADYWTAYVVSFVSNEQVRLASTSIVRVQEYRREYNAHPGQRVDVQQSPCPGCVRAGDYWVSGLAIDQRPAGLTPGRTFRPASGR